MKTENSEILCMYILFIKVKPYFSQLLRQQIVYIWIKYVAYSNYSNKILITLMGFLF